MRTCDVAFSRAELESALPRFVGPIVQTPPRSPRSSTAAAPTTNTRAPASTIPRVPRAVEIAAIELVDWSPPLAVLRVACGKGTYVRVLAEDIAGALGSCAHLVALRRTVSGPFALAARRDARGPRGDGRRGARPLLLPSDAPLSGMARLDVDASTAQALVAGRVGRLAAGMSGRYRCYGPQGRFLGLVEANGGALRSVRLARTDDNAVTSEAARPAVPGFAPD